MPGGMNCAHDLPISTNPTPRPDLTRVDTARLTMTANPETPALLSTSQLAEHLGCSKRHVCRLRDRGLPCIRVGALVRFDPEEVRRWLEGDGAVRCAPNNDPHPA